jgi:hypothetical protein
MVVMHRRSVHPRLSSAIFVVMAGLRAGHPRFRLADPPSRAVEKCFPGQPCGPHESGQRLSARRRRATKTQHLGLAKAIPDLYGRLRSRLRQIPRRGLEACPGRDHQGQADRASGRYVECRSGA